MALNLEAEIAGRLGVRAEDVRPVLETVIERVRQQVAHYGYARLAGLGTFRGHDGSILFEPDPGLAEAVNVRFAGLGDIEVEDLSPPAPPAPFPEFDEEPFVEAESEIPGWDQPYEEEESSPEFEEYGTPEGGADKGWPEPSFPDAEEESASWPAPEPELDDEDFVTTSKEAEEERWREESGWPLEAADEDAFVDEAPLAEDDTTELRWQDEAEALEEDAPSVRWGDEPPAPGKHAESRESEFASLPDFDEEEPAAGEYEDLNQDEEDAGNQWQEEQAESEGGELWHEQQETGEHPLGPMPGTPYEEADYSFIEERDSREETPFAWAPIENESETDKHPVPPLAPDRSAKPHERVRQQAMRARQSREDAGPNRSALWLGAAIVLVVAAAAVGYFAFMRPPAPAAPEIVEQSEGDALTDSAALQTDTTATQPDLTAVATDTAAAAPETPEPAAESTPLRSADPIDPSQGGYTVIVASETSRSSAEEIMERYRRDGYRTGILEAREGGVTRYRIGVGQFRSISQAERTRTQLAGSGLPPDAWVRRIR